MASTTYAHKPENALRRANELISIGQSGPALTLLHDVLSSRRQRTWSPSHEKIMITYIDLCLILNRSREAKDGLHQYRNLSQSQAPGSLEIVIHHLLDSAEVECSKAKSNSNEILAAKDRVLVMKNTQKNLPEDNRKDILRPLFTPLNRYNNGLMSIISSDQVQYQHESSFLLPRIKFLWESYRAVLDILKSNSKLERLYHLTAIGALKFCATYNRRTEFRRCCDLLRMHLLNLQKYGGVSAMAKVEEGGKPNNKVRGWEGWTSESIELHLQTRFVQLDTASTLHLYTEGFRTVEDIFNILQTSHSRKRVTSGVTPSLPKAKLMAAYYKKLTTLYWVSENYLFHAFAWYKFHMLSRDYNRDITAEHRSLQASAVLLSALCIPTLPDSGLVNNKKAIGGEDDDTPSISNPVRDIKEKTTRIATLLGSHSRYPTRETLISEIRSKNIMSDVPHYLRDIYKLLEENFNPLVLVKEAKPLLERLENEKCCSIGDGSSTFLSSDTIPKKDDHITNTSGENATLSIYIQPLKSVLLLKLLYSLSQSYHTISLNHVSSLTSGLGFTFTEVEKVIVNLSSSRDSNCTNTGSNGIRIRIDHRCNCLRFGTATSEGSRRLNCDTMRTQLTDLSTHLESVCKILSPPDTAIRAAERRALFGEVRVAVDEEHNLMLARKDKIEKRKEEGERLKEEKRKGEERKRLIAQATARAEEDKRLAREQKVREREKLDKIRKEMEMIEKKKYLLAMGQKVETMSHEELEKIDPAELAKEHAAKAAKKKGDEERKIREMQKRLDYIVRAKRIEEIPLVKKRYEEKVKVEKKRYESNVFEKARRAKLQWKTDCKEKAELDLHSVFSHMQMFEKLVMTGREITHEAICKIEDKRVEKLKLEQDRKYKEEAIHNEKEKYIKAMKDGEERIQTEKRNKEKLEMCKKNDIGKEIALEIKKERVKVINTHTTKEIHVPSFSSAKYVPPAKRFGAGSSGTRWGDSSCGNSFGGVRGGGYGGGKYETGGRHVSGGDFYGKRDSERVTYGDRGGNRYMRTGRTEKPQDKYRDDNVTLESRSSRWNS